MSDAPERISERLKRLSDAATPMNLASAEIYEEGEEIMCPLCQSDGYVEASTYVNMDGVALNVQFSGIGGEFGANEEFVLALIEAYRSGDLVPSDVVAEKVREALTEAAYIARNACLVPPDGGNPTEYERLVCEEASRHILALRDQKGAET